MQKFQNTTISKNSRYTTNKEKFTLQKSHNTATGHVLKKSLITSLCILVFSLNTICVCAAEPPVIDVSTLLDPDSDEYMLQKMAVAEAEGEGVWGQALVIQTILNRVDSPDFPNSVYDVIYQENQFTSISNGRYDKVEPNKDSQQAYELLDDMQNLGQTYFERPSSSKWHSQNLEKVTEYRNHIFYKVPGED